MLSKVAGLKVMTTCYLEANSFAHISLTMMYVVGVLLRRTVCRYGHIYVSLSCAA